MINLKISFGKTRFLSRWGSWRAVGNLKEAEDDVINQHHNLQINKILSLLEEKIGEHNKNMRWKRETYRAYI